ncbi:sugar-binding protein [soil metagenome]
MKRALLLGISLAMGLAVAATAHAQAKKSLVFVVNGASDFWKIAEACVAKAQGELPAYALSLKYPEQAAPAVQQRVLEDLVAGGAAGIMVSAVDPKNQVTQLKAIAKQTVLFTTDSDAVGSDRVAYIGSSNVELGKNAGQLMLKALPNGGKCIGFVGLLGADNAKERIQGINEVIKGSKVQLADVRGDEIDFGRAKRNVEDALAANPDVSCMVGIYSYNTPYIYQVLKAANKLNAIKIIGFDEDPITLGGVKEGSITGTVVQQPFEWGYQGMKLMAKFIEGDKKGIPAGGIIIVPGKVIDKDNFDAFMGDMKKMMGK